MTLNQAAQNIIFLDLPVALYALIIRWRFKFSAAEIMNRLGLLRGHSRFYLLALAMAVPASLFTIWVASSTSTFKGSMTAPFVDAPPTLMVISKAFIYGFLGTGFPEELLFRGLIAGALFRRVSFWKANCVQTLIFMAPHLLILFVAPRLWPLIIGSPLVLGLICGRLRQASGGIWPCVLFHAIPNTAGALAVIHWV